MRFSIVYLTSRGFAPLLRSPCDIQLGKLRIFFGFNQFSKF
ncbi:hypothetical protein ACFP3I_10655 [Chryseobacterium arachidis]